MEIDNQLDHLSSFVHVFEDKKRGYLELITAKLNHSTCLATENDPEFLAKLSKVT